MKILLSKIPSYNTLKVYESIRKNIAEDRRSFLIVPEQFTLQKDMQLINNIDRDCVISSKVFSFNSLSEYILTEVGGKTREVITEIGKNMLLSNLLKSGNEGLTIFKDNYENTGFIQNLSQLISELKQDGINSEKLLECIDNCDDETLKYKLKDIKKIFEEYNDFMKGKYLDGDDRLNLCIEKLDQANFLKDSYFYFDNFNFMSKIQLEFLKRLSEITDNITMCIHMDPVMKNPEYEKLGNFDVFLTSKRFFDSLTKMFDCTILEARNQKLKDSDMNYLLDNFSSYKKQIYESDVNNIFILRHNSTEEEIENIAVIIKKLIKDKRLRYKDFSIILTNLLEYRDRIVKIFNRENISFFMDEDNNLFDNYIVKSIICVLKLKLYSFQKSDLKFFINSPLFMNDDITKEDIEFFCNHLDRINLRNEMIYKDIYFTLPENMHVEDSNRLSDIYKSINRVRDHLLNLISPIIQMKEKEKISVYLENFYQFLTQQNIVDSISKYHRFLYDIDKLNLYNELSQVWDKMINILDQQFILLGDFECSFENFYNMLIRGLKSTAINIIPPSKDQIHVGDLERSIQTNRKVHFILGLNDAYFPPESTVNALFLDKETQKLGDWEVNLKHSIQSTNYLLNFHSIISQTKKLYLSYSLFDYGHQNLSISHELSEIRNYMPKLLEYNCLNLSQAYKNLSQDMLTKDIIANIKNKNNKDNKVDEGIINYYLSKDENEEKVEAIFSGLNYNNNKGNLKDEISEKIFKKGLSASQIDSFIRCPYKHFLDYAIKPSKKQNNKIDVMTGGTIVHKNMEKLAEKLQNINIDDIDLKKLIDDQYDKINEDILDSYKMDELQNKYFIKKIKENVLLSSKKIIDQLQRGNFRILKVEEKYGKNCTFPEVRIGDINFSGRMDRIDIADDLVRIIDYKKKNKKFDLKNISNGLDLQLFIYMLSINENPTIKFAGAFYLPLTMEKKSLDKQGYEHSDMIVNEYYKMKGFLPEDEGILKANDKYAESVKDSYVLDQSTIVLSNEGFDVLKKVVDEIIKINVEQLRSGCIEVSPVEKTCDFCDYGSICKISNSNKIRVLKMNEELKEVKKNGKPIHNRSTKSNRNKK